MSKIVVIIDDEISITRMIESALEQYEIDHLIFNSSDSFLKSLESIVNDAYLFVIDLMMKPISGLELVKIIRDKGIKTPIYIVTGYTESETKTIHKHINKVYTKPFDIFEFVDDIKELRDKSNDR
jgi:DNA-binding response OmpR family regulator